MNFYIASYDIVFTTIYTTFKEKESLNCVTQTVGREANSAQSCVNGIVAITDAALPHRTSCWTSAITDAAFPSESWPYYLHLFALSKRSVSVKIPRNSIFLFEWKPYHVIWLHTHETALTLVQQLFQLFYIWL